jgi:hypothetical protein
MTLLARYSRLTFWNKLAFWGGVASIVSVPLAVWLYYRSAEEARLSTRATSLAGMLLPEIEGPTPVVCSFASVNWVLSTDGERVLEFGFCKLTLFVTNKTLFVSMPITDISGDTLAILTRNEWEVNPKLFPYRRNFDQKGLEILNSEGVPVFQLEFTNTASVSIRGIFYYDGYTYGVGKNGLTRMQGRILGESLRHYADSIGLIQHFKYPAERHPNERDNPSP